MINSPDSFLFSVSTNDRRYNGGIYIHRNMIAWNTHLICIKKTCQTWNNQDIYILCTIALTAKCLCMLSVFWTSYKQNINITGSENHIQCFHAVMVSRKSQVLIYGLPVEPPSQVRSGENCSIFGKFKILANLREPKLYMILSSWETSIFFSFSHTYTRCFHTPQPKPLASDPFMILSLLQDDMNILQNDILKNNMSLHDHWTL